MTRHRLGDARLALLGCIKLYLCKLRCIAPPLVQVVSFSERRTWYMADTQFTQLSAFRFGFASTCAELVKTCGACSGPCAPVLVEVCSAVET